MSYSPGFTHTMEVISGRAVSHLSLGLGGDQDALAMSLGSLPLMTPELSSARNPDHNLFIPIDLEPLPPPIMDILNPQEAENMDFGAAGPLSSHSIDNPDLQETEDVEFQVMMHFPPSDVHTPDSQEAEEAYYQERQFHPPPDMDTPYPQEMGYEVLSLGSPHLLSDVHTPDSQGKDEVDFEVAGPLPPQDMYIPNSQPRHIYVPQTSNGYSTDSETTEDKEHPSILLIAERSNPHDTDSDMSVTPERLDSPSTPKMPKSFKRAQRPKRHQVVAFPDLPGKKLLFEKRAKLHTETILVELMLQASLKRSNLVVGTNEILNAWRILDSAEEIGPHIIMLRLMPKPMKMLERDVNALNRFQKSLTEIAGRHRFFILSCREIVLGRFPAIYLISDDFIDEVGAKNAFDWTVLAPKVHDDEYDSQPGIGLLILSDRIEVPEPGPKRPDGKPERVIESTRSEVKMRNDKPKRLHPRQKYGDVIWDENGHPRHIERDTPTATSYLKHMPPVDGETDEFDDSLIAFQMKVSCLSGDGQSGLTPTRAISSGADFFIVLEEIWDADNPAEMAQKYREEGWKAYLAKTQPQTNPAGLSSKSSRLPVP